MSNILTPITLWKHSGVPEFVMDNVLSSTQEDGLEIIEHSLRGKTTPKGSVSIYTVEVRPLRENDEKLPCFILFSSAEVPPDVTLAMRYAKLGYCVFCMDYRGKTEGSSHYTEYPEDLSFANLSESKNKLFTAEEGAEKTPWYEWILAAKYLINFILQLNYVSGLGAMGIREGGDIVWKLVSFGDLVCGIVINANGWMCYKKKNSQAEQGEMCEADRLFVAGLDSQSYAPFVKCPILMVDAVTDSYSDPNRAYDTFSRINPDYVSVIDYSSAYNGTIDDIQIKNIDMFLEKYVKNRQIYISNTPTLSFIEENGLLYAYVKMDEAKDIDSFSVCYADGRCGENGVLEWKQGIPDVKDDFGQRFLLQLQQNSQQLYAFGRACSSSGFTCSTKINYKTLDKTYKNTILHSNILYDGSMNAEDVFFPADKRKYNLYVFPFEDRTVKPLNVEGYGKIRGATCRHGLKLYRISNLGFLPQQNSSLHIDFYCQKDCEITLSVLIRDSNDIDVPYSEVFYLSAQEGWTRHSVSCDRFHSQEGKSLPSFLGGRALLITAKDDSYFVVTNILWI